MRRALTRLSLLALASVLTLAALELVLRAREPAPAFRVWRPGREVVLAPRPELMNGVDGPSRFRISSLGFRSDERPPDVALSILALGGSATECLYLDQDEAWPARLQSELAARLARGVWVANAGKSGRTTRDHVLQLRALLEQEPHFERVLLLTGVNDLCAWLAAGASAPGPAELERAFEVVPRALAGGRWWRRTAVFELLRGWQLRWHAAPLAQDPEGAIYATWRAHRSGAPRWLEDLPDAAPVLASFHAELVEMAEDCARHGSGLVLVTQPALWRARLAPEFEARLWMGGVGDYQARAGCDYYTSAALTRGLALFNAELEAVARERGLPLFDLARELDGDPRCFYDDVHFDEEGARRVATFLTAELAALERN